MEIRTRRFQVNKRYPLTISRGTFTSSENLFVEVEHEGIVGIGEMAPTSGGDKPETVETAEAFFHQSNDLIPHTLLDGVPWEMQEIEDLFLGTGDITCVGNRAAWAALDIALHDWTSKRLGIPLYRLFGLYTTPIVPTSLTIGINLPEVIRERVPEILQRTKAHALKVKLGSPEGIEADRAMFASVQEAAANAEYPLIKFRVDANGGWNVEDARKMLRWLAEEGVEYVEQPLPRGQEDGLPHIHRDSPLPIFVDESTQVASEIPKVAAHVDGVNLKLMKCGGLREGLKFIHVARGHNLKVMIGCMSETSLAITAAAHLSSLADYLDLDSHLNLLDDPFSGAKLEDGRIVPNDEPGLGVRMVRNF